MDFITEYAPAIVAILAIAVITVAVIAKGLDGTLVQGAIASISTLGGYPLIRAAYQKRQNNKTTTKDS